MMSSSLSRLGTRRGLEILTYKCGLVTPSAFRCYSSKSPNDSHQEKESERMASREWLNRNSVKKLEDSRVLKLPVGDKLSEFEILSYKIHFIRIDNLGYRLKLASLYMQATEGQNNTPEPPKDAHYEHSYWTAWKALGNMSKEEATKEYVRIAKLRLEKRDPDILINN